MRFQVYIYQDEDGAFIAECPIIPGCVSDGTTFEEAEANIKDAIGECLELRREMGLPSMVYLLDVEVALPISAYQYSVAPGVYSRTYTG